MMHKRRCRCCRQTFSISRNPNQTYCSKALCQTFRRQQWKKKHNKDPDYQANQRAAQQAWLKRRQDYYQDYRARHPDYVATNRRQQQQRNCRSRQAPAVDIGKIDLIAKRNALLTDFPFITMPYEYFHGEFSLIAKRNAFYQKNPYIPIGYEQFIGRYL
jgi:hypothetical protein